MKPLKEIIRREEINENRKWKFAEICIADESRADVVESGWFFKSEKDISQYTTIGDGFFQEIFKVDIAPEGEAIGCRLYGRRSKDGKGAIYFAYRERGEDLIFVRPPRIEVDEEGIKLISGNTAKLMYQRPLPEY